MTCAISLLKKCSFGFDTPFIDSSRFTIGERLRRCIIVESAPTGVGRRIIGGGDEGTSVLSLGAGLVHEGLATPILDRGRIDDETAKVCISGGGEIGGENANNGDVNPAGGDDNDGGDVNGGGDDVP